MLSAVRCSATICRFLSRPLRADELHLEARLTLEVEDLLFSIAHLDQRLANVVLRHDLVRLLRNAELEEARTRVGDGRPHARGRRTAVGRQLDLLRSDDASLVLHVHRHRPSGVTGLRDDDVDHQRGVLEDALRRAHTIDLNVARQLGAADAHREDRQLLGLQGEQGVTERNLARVRAVGDQHDTRHRETASPRARLERWREQPSLRALNVRPSSARSDSRPTKTERPDQEPVGQRLDDWTLSDPNCCRRKFAPRLSAQSGICMLLESSSSTARRLGAQPRARQTSA